MENRFDIYDLPEGHEARFQMKLDAAKNGQRSHRILRWTAVAAAAAAAILCVIQIPGGNRHFFRAHTPEAVYTAYLDKVGSYYEQLASSDALHSEDWEAVLASLTNETIPLFDQLPEEMPDREKVRVLKRYYGELLDGAELLQNEWNN